MPSSSINSHSETSLHERRLKERDRRHSLLEKRTSSSSVDVDVIPQSFHSHILGDYLDNKRLHPTTKLRDVVADCKAYGRFITHEGSQYPHLFKRFKQDEMGFDAYYRSWRHACCRDQILRKEWASISSFLNPMEVSALRSASPSFAMARMVKFFQVKESLHQAMIASQQHQEKSSDTGGYYSEEDIFDDARLGADVIAVFKDRFRQVEGDGGGGGGFDAIDNITRFHLVFLEAAARSERERLLREELGCHGLDLRRDSQFCKNYIDGDTDASLQEVVATMKISSFLFDHGGHRCFSANRELMKARMKQMMECRLFPCWYQACEAALALPLLDWDSYGYDGGDEEGDEYEDYDSDEVYDSDDGWEGEKGGHSPRYAFLYRRHFFNYSTDFEGDDEEDDDDDFSYSMSDDEWE